MRSSFDDRQSFDTATEQFTLSDASDSNYKPSVSPSTLEDDQGIALLLCCILIVTDAFRKLPSHASTLWRRLLEQHAQRLWC